jgi:putative FmdB family regulatory protein
MPTYEYACDRCGEKFERFLPISSKAEQPCPKCGKAARRLISGGAGLIFKGSGFYITDYRSSDYKSKASSEKSNGAASGGGKGPAAAPASDKTSSTSKAPAGESKKS